MCNVGMVMLAKIHILYNIIEIFSYNKTYYAYSVYTEYEIYLYIKSGLLIITDMIYNPRKKKR